MSRYLIAACIVIAGAAWIPAGCNFPSCTEIGCLSHFRATFNKSSAWENGDWKKTILVEGSAIGSCEVAIHEGTVARDEGCTDGLYLRASGV